METLSQHHSLRLCKGLVLHGNRRQPGNFHPFEGLLLEPNVDNIKQASEGKLTVNMSWLKHPKVPADDDGHPLTGPEK